MKVLEKAVVAINALHVNACPQIKASPLLEDLTPISHTSGNSFTIQKLQ